MQTAINHIINRMENTLTGDPWYGRSVFSILEDCPAEKTSLPETSNSHSLPDLLWHMITWAEFTLRRIEGRQDDPKEMEILDWRKLDPSIHTWANGLREIRQVHDQIIARLKEKEDDFLLQKVDYRSYDFGYLLHGLIDHTIYHLGQIALLQKQ